MGKRIIFIWRDPFLTVAALAILILGAFYAFVFVFALLNLEDLP